LKTTFQLEWVKLGTIQDYRIMAKKLLLILGGHGSCVGSRVGWEDSKSKIGQLVSGSSSKFRVM